MSELYNLSHDPRQEKNTIRENLDKAKEVHQLLVKFMRDTNVPDGLLTPRLELKV